ncbi:MAG: YfhO family protein [Oscillospiraceae bacterium]|nr:YfhO family protein [Oscillospiraceae bacterium]
MTDYQQKSRHWQAFFLSMAISAVIFIPFVIYDRGYFIFLGDFNVQQIPFYKLVHEAVRSGDIFWNWYTDLGVNFVGSYTFYNLTSPFFWLTLPFPTSFVPHLMAPLLILKNSCAALTSYFYLERFVRDKRYAVLGALLYAYSGFMLYNTFFNHFHEVAVFFPLLLITLERLITENRRGGFALAVAVNAFVNYWFFIGEVIFVILYFCIRSTSPQWKMSLRKFFWTGFEAVLGMGLAMFAFLPSVLAIMGNPRTTSDNLVSGWNFWVYWHEQRLPAILGSFLFPPHVPSRPNLFPDHGAQWASLSAWLPMVGVSGAVAYCLWAKKDWLRKMLGACLLMALIPGFNSLFILLNNSYYARWFYMFILLMCLATVIAMERRGVDYQRGVRIAGILTLSVTAAIGLTPKKVDGEWSLGLASNIPEFWLYAVIAIIGVLLTWLIIHNYKGSKAFFRVCCLSLAAYTVLFAWVYFIIAKSSKSHDNWVIDTCIEGRETLQLPDDEFCRSDFYKTTDNMGMFWHLPNIQAFHSIVPTSIMEFYPEVGVKRDVSSKPDVQYYALRSLLSVKWLFIEESSEEQSPMPGYHLVSNHQNFNIYENENHLPMGFAYTEYIDSSDFDETSKDLRCRLLLRGVLLEQDAIVRNSDILTKVPDHSLGDLSEDDFREDVADRRSMSAYSFEKDNLGFTSKINLKQESLVFYSVPYDKGWSATVNGEPVQIEKASIGFMAVRAPAGDNEIRFDYMTPGLLTGLKVSGLSVLILLGYLLLCHRLTRVRPQRQVLLPLEDLSGEDDPEEQLTLEEVIHQPHPDAANAPNAPEACPEDEKEEP